MATYNYVGSDDGLWTDPLNWDVGVVPLWDYGSTVEVGAGIVTLRDIEPNNMTVLAGITSSTIFGGVIALDNAAFGPGLDVQASNSMSPASIYNATFLAISVVGYDTNYGTIEAKHDQTSDAYYVLDIGIQPGSQLNNAGTITVDGQISDHSSLTSLSVGGGGVLNNDGQINLFDDSTAELGTVIGSGTITLARPNFVNAGYPQLVSSEPFAATQTVELDAGQLRLYQNTTEPQLFQATIAGWNPQSQVVLAGTFQGNSLAYTPTSPGHGDLVVSGSVPVLEGVIDETFTLHLAGNYATSDFALATNPFETTVSIQA